MSDLKHKIQELKEKKARQFMEIEMLSEVNDSVYTKFGKTVAEIMLKEKELVRESQNPLREN
jgi:ribose 5-phosphate isomerase RpiB